MITLSENNNLIEINIILFSKIYKINYWDCIYSFSNTFNLKNKIILLK